METQENDLKFTVVVIHKASISAPSLIAGAIVGSGLTLLAMEANNRGWANRAMQEIGGWASAQAVLGAKAKTTDTLSKIVESARANAKTTAQSFKNALSPKVVNKAE